MIRTLKLVALGAVLVAAPVFAQTPAATTTTPATKTVPVTAAAKKQADLDYKTAKEKCKAITVAADKKACYQSAKAEHKTAIAPKTV